MKEKHRIESLQEGARFRYRLRANPSVCRKGKRLGLLEPVAQEEWLHRQGTIGGFRPLTIYRSDETMVAGVNRREQNIRLFSVLFDGLLTVTDASAFQKSLGTGVGRGKAMGLGLLSVVPA